MIKWKSGRMIKNPDKIRESWNNLFRGSGNAHQVAVLEEGLQFKKIGINPNEAQFLETRKFQISEIARIFRVPPHMIGDLEHATFSNIEHESINFVDNTIVPWVSRLEQSMQKALINESKKQEFFIKFNLTARLRGDANSRASFYQTMRQNGIMSANDVRQLEDMNLISETDGGFKYLVNGNFVEMSSAGSWTEKYSKMGGEV
jgi:HK97 family phage portal protein